MKKTSLDVILTLTIGLFLLTGCNKKSNETSGSQSLNSSNNKGNDTLNLSKDDEQQREFALAELAPETDFVFELTDDYEGVVIKNYKGRGKKIVIPSEIQNVPVIELKENAFSMSTVETVVIPDTVKKIGPNLFNACKYLKNVELPKSITSIPDSCFYNCESLSDFKIPETITNIGSSAFDGTALETIYIPDTVTSFISTDSFNMNHEPYESSLIFCKCKNLKTVHLPKNITVIPSGMFIECNSLETITLPEGIKEIGEDAFKKCTSLKNLIIPSSVTIIRSGAFNNCGITKLEIPDSVTILECKFYNCPELAELHLPNSLTEIKNSLFHEQYNYDKKPDNKIQKLNIPSSIHSIDYIAFKNMKELTDLIIPDSITEIEWIEKVGYGAGGYYSDDKGTHAFLGCSGLPLTTQKKLKQLGYPGKFSYD